MDSGTKMMLCAGEVDWPLREFGKLMGSFDYACRYCGWCQISHAKGCRELILAAEWHSIEELDRHVRIARASGLELVGTVQIRIPADAS